MGHSCCVDMLQVLTDEYYRLMRRSRKNTHISRISNSVTYLRSYTNSATGRNSMPGANIAALIADVAALIADVAA